jgi:uncharacterized membrane protein YhiD involved in acid resistance
MGEMVGFSDIIKKSIMSSELSSTLSVSDIALILIATFVMGMFVFYIYRKTFQGVLYTASFNTSLVMVAMVTSVVIMTISSNIILSLGMVGALSIVRFRTAIKDSMDIVFMFWAISIGIANGAGYFKISITGSVIIALALFVLLKYRSANKPYLLIVNCESKNTLNLENEFKKIFPSYNVKSKTVVKDETELTIEIRIHNEDTKFMERISELAGVKKSALLSYNGDYVS